MENNLKVFESALFGQVRSIVDESNEPWFAAMDVCKCLDLKNTSVAPKADYYDQVLTAESTYTTTQIAKEFGMSGKRLNEVLHAMGVQYKVNEQWVLYADYCGKGYTKTLTFTYSDADGQLHSRQSTAWTEKGGEFIHKLMRENQK